MLNNVKWQPDLPDFRDYPFVGVTAIDALPTSVDLRDSGFLNTELTVSPSDSPILDMFSFTIKKEFPAEILDPRLRAGFGKAPQKGNFPSLRDETKAIIKLGLKLTEGSLDYYRLDGTVNTAKQCLADGYPFMFGYSTFDSPPSKILQKNPNPGKGPFLVKGVISVPDVNDSLIGSKLGLAVGYNDDDKYFILKAYREIGDEGYLYMPFDYVSNGKLCNDFWTLRKAL